jgi:hypothetical protein
MTPDQMLLEALKAHFRSIVKNGGNALLALLSDDEIRLTFSNSEVVYVAWPDANIWTGFQLMPIKGWEKAKAPGAGSMLSTTLPCPDEATALDWLALYGDPDMLPVRLFKPSKATRH